MISPHTVNRRHYIRLLNRIIAVAHDGHALHARAVARTQGEDAPLCAVMMRVAGSSAAIIHTLGRHVLQAGGRPARHGTVLGGVRAGFGWLGTVLGDVGIQYVSQEDASRARLIRACRLHCTTKHCRVMHGRCWKRWSVMRSKSGSNCMVG